MKYRKTLWLICMAVLCLVLYTIVISRTENMTSLIFGGTDGAFVTSDSVNMTDPNRVSTPEPTEDIWPDIDITLQQYSIVNKDNLISSAYEPDVGLIEGTRYMQFALMAKPYLEAMIQDCEAAGFTVVVNGAYRTYSYQNELFNRKASQIAYGMGVTDYLDPLYQDAAAEAEKYVMKPGASEHQLGLAVDLMDKLYTNLDYDKMDHEMFEWLDEHCAEYGFIKRYPTRKLLLTGYDEPWHYRYVGVEAATFIMEQGLCYEEFYKHYVPDFTY